MNNIRVNENQRPSIEGSVIGNNKFVKVIMDTVSTFYPLFYKLIEKICLFVRDQLFDISQKTKKDNFNNLASVIGSPARLINDLFNQPPLSDSAPAPVPVAPVPAAQAPAPVPVAPAPAPAPAPLVPPSIPYAPPPAYSRESATLVPSRGPRIEVCPEPISRVVMPSVKPNPSLLSCCVNVLGVAALATSVALLTIFAV